MRVELQAEARRDVVAGAVFYEQLWVGLCRLCGDGRDRC